MAVPLIMTLPVRMATVAKGPTVVGVRIAGKPVVSVMSITVRVAAAIQVGPTEAPMLHPSITVLVTCIT